MHRSLEDYCVTLVLSYRFRRSHFRHQSVSSSVQPERSLVAKSGTMWARDLAGSFYLKCRIPRYILWIFYMPQIYDMGPTAILPSERRRVEDFVDLKNPTTSAWFEHANLRSSTLLLDHRNRFLTHMKGLRSLTILNLRPYSYGRKYFVAPTRASSSFWLAM